MLRSVLKNKKIAKDTFFTMLSLCLYNFILQIVIYPRLCSRVGDDYFGKIVYMLSFVSLFSIAIGNSVGDEYLLFTERGTAPRFPDVFKTLLLFCGAGLLIFALYAVFTGEEIKSLGLCLFLTGVTAFRVFAAALFKIQKKFTGFFVYHCVLCAGYIAGVLVFASEKLWYFAFMAGELAACVFTFFYCRSGQFLGAGEYAFRFRKEAFFLLLSSLAHMASLNFDRILLGRMQGNYEVSLYYVSSLLGKTIVLFSSPLNTMLLAYGYKFAARLSVKKFIKIVGIIISGSLLIFLCAYFATTVFVPIFYPSLYQDAKSLFAPVTMGQILLFLPSMPLTILLMVGGSKWHAVVQYAYIALYFGLLWILVQRLGVLGAGYAAILAGAAKFFLIVAITIKLLTKGEHSV